MGRFTPNAELIYESPDGGDTIYAREQGSGKRHLISISFNKVKMQQDLKDTQLWHEIRQAAEHNPALKTALEQCILLYHIGKKDGS